MLINRQNLEFLYFQFLTNFQDGYAQATPLWDKYAMKVPSSTQKNVYGWLGQLPAVRKWVGPRIINDAASRDYSLVNEDYEDTIGLERNKIEDDQWNLFSPVVTMLGQESKWWPDDLVTTTLINGISTPCFDGQNFFSNSHPIDINNSAAGTYQNRYDSNAAGGSVAFPLTAANYATLKANMSQFKGENGRPMNLRPTHVMVPPQLEQQAKQILSGALIAQTFGSNTAAAAPTNIWAGDAEIIVNPRLGGDANTWYLMCLDRPIKPLLFQERKPMEFVQRTDPASDNVFHQKTFEYGVDGRGAAGYSFPFLCIRAST